MECTDIVVYQGCITTYSMALALSQINKDYNPEIRKANKKEVRQYDNRP